jgi:hypothetical protein
MRVISFIILFCLFIFLQCTSGPRCMYPMWASINGSHTQWELHESKGSNFVIRKHGIVSIKCDTTWEQIDTLRKE